MADEIRKYQNAVDIIKTAILQSQARAAKAVNQEQLALYYGIGRYVSANSRKKNWGKGAIETISEQLRKELPGLRGFSATSMRNMRTFYEEWRQLESNSSVATDEIQELPPKSSVATDEITIINTSDNSAVVTADFTDDAEIRQLQLANLPVFPLVEFFYAGYIMQDFRQPMGVATYKTAEEMDPELLKALPPKEELQRVFVESSKKKEE